MRSSAERAYFFPNGSPHAVVPTRSIQGTRTYDFHQFVVVATQIEPVTSSFGSSRSSKRRYCMWSTSCNCSLTDNLQRSHTNLLHRYYPAPAVAATCGAVEGRAGTPAGGPVQVGSARGTGDKSE